MVQEVGSRRSISAMMSTTLDWWEAAEVWEGLGSLRAQLWAVAVVPNAVVGQLALDGNLPGPRTLERHFLSAAWPSLRCKDRSHWSRAVWAAAEKKRGKTPSHVEPSWGRPHRLDRLMSKKTHCESRPCNVCHKSHCPAWLDTYEPMVFQVQHPQSWQANGAPPRRSPPPGNKALIRPY